MRLATRMETGKIAKGNEVWLFCEFAVLLTPVSQFDRFRWRGRDAHDD